MSETDRWWVSRNKLPSGMYDVITFEIVDGQRKVYEHSGPLPEEEAKAYATARRVKLSLRPAEPPRALLVKMPASMYRRLQVAAEVLETSMAALARKWFDEQLSELEEMWSAKESE